ncbi:MAG: hypothetical protein NC043_06950 [Muribaculaceae bacterium]|nr:hypothetical protein [Muribaculaceae bacterium]
MKTAETETTEKEMAKETVKVTRRALEAMDPGDSLVFDLPDYLAVESGKNVAYSAAKVFGRRFSCQVSRTVKNRLTVTRTA